LDSYELVYPAAIPVKVHKGGRFVFARSVAIFVLNMLQEDVDEDEQLEYTTMDNVELGECLLAAGAIHDSVFGGVVVDGAPNGFIQAVQIT
jgi:hypothetical protein